MPRIRLTIQVKVLALVTVMVVGTAVVLGYAHVRQSTAAIDRQTDFTKQTMLHDAVNLGRMLEAALVSEEQINDPQQMRQLAGKVMRNMNGRVTGFTAYAADPDAPGGFSTVTSTIPPATDGSQSETEAAALEALRNDRVKTTVGDPDVDPTADVTVPIHLGSKLIGGVRMRVNLQEAYANADAERDRVANDTVRATVLVSTIAVLVAAALAYVFSLTIVRPVKRLTRVAEAISLGQTDVEVGAASNDEIGDLAASFDRMVTAVRFLTLEATADGEVSAA